MFALPPLLGWIYYFYPELLPSGRQNHGELIVPSRPITDLTLSRLGGETFDWNELKGKWALVVISRGYCAEDCRRQLSIGEQLRRGQRAGTQRIQLVLLLLKKPGELRDQEIRSSAIGAANELDAASPVETADLVLVAQLSAQKQVEERFDLADVYIEQQFFLIDAYGHLMMRHDMTEVSPQETLADLKTLLTASENWERK